MGTTFQCPSCSRQLFYESGDNAFQICRHCTAKIIVPSIVIHEANIRKSESGTSGGSLEVQRNLRIAEVQSELNAGRKIAAIKLFRESFGADLSTSKQAVELIERGGRLPGALLTTVQPDRPIGEKVYTNTPVNSGGALKVAPIIFWIILSIGIAIAAIIFGDE